MSIKSSGNYKIVPHTMGPAIGKLVATLTGAAGIVVVVLSLGYALLNGPEGLEFTLIGAFLSILLLPGLYRSGIEIDQANRRFRHFEGTLGKIKGEWIDIEKEDYLAIVGVRGASSMGTPRTGTLKVNVAKSKVYFWSGTRHTEVFKGDYEEAKAFANEFATPFGLWVNDVNKDQNIPGLSQNAFNNF